MLITEHGKKLNISFNEKLTESDVSMWKDSNGTHMQVGNESYGDNPLNIQVWETGEGLHSAITKDNGNQAKGEGAVAEGINTDANALGSHTEGNQSIVTAAANFAHAEGNVTTAGGQASHAEGNNTVTNNQAEHAEGKFNASHTGATEADNTIHSIGIGKASGEVPGGDRKNAVEVMENGDIYIIGIGGFTGANYSEASTLQEVIAQLTPAASE